MKTTFNLFCLPFAGGNKYSYYEYIKRAPDFLNIISLEYPGRGSRGKDPLIFDLDLLIDDLYMQIRNIVGQRDYAIYGHSMGGLAAYLLTKKLIWNKHKAPLHLFITGTTGPSAASRCEKKKHSLPKKDFIEELKKFDGIPEEILQSEELLSYFEPILRADFMATENYVYKDDIPLNVPVTVITGTEEDMEMEEIHLWQKETKCLVDFKQMSGNHFFIFKHPHSILDIICQKLV